MEIYQIDFNGHPHPSGDWANNYILLDDEAVKEIIAGTDKRWVCVKYHDGRESSRITESGRLIMFLQFRTQARLRVHPFVIWFCDGSRVPNVRINVLLQRRHRRLHAAGSKG